MLIRSTRKVIALSRKYGRMPLQSRTSATKAAFDTELNPAEGDSADINRSMVALGRYGTTEELAQVVVFLASPPAAT
jgi:3-oxoacyl-[acyl-carrier protein] reductase